MSQDNEPVTQPVDPQYTLRLPRGARYPLSIHDDPLAPRPVHKQQPAPETAEERAQRVAQQLGAYWGRSCVAAWRTVFPPGWTRRPQ